MAIFNDLPIELLIKIIELAVEDAIAINDDKLRQQILFRLALVSKDFTLPSQSILWRKIFYDSLTSPGDILKNEIAVGKIVEELKLSLHYGHSSIVEVSNLKIFLNRLKRVDSLELSINEASYSLIKLDELLEIPSLKEIKSLAFYGTIPVNLDCDLQLPSLQHLRILNLTHKNDDFFSKIIESSSNTLTSLQLTSTRFDSYSSPKTFGSIKRHAPRLITLKIINCGDQLVLDLLPLCFSLKSLAVHSDDSFDITVAALNLLSPLSQVECLSIRIASLLSPLRNNVGRSLVENEDFNSFITALNQTQFVELKNVDLYLGSYLNDNIWQAVVESELERVDEKLQKRGIELRVGI